MTNLEKIANFAKSVHAGNTDGHDFEHIQRVVALAKKILATEPTADADFVLACCYLHDSYDEKIFEDVTTQKAVVRNFLTAIRFDKVDALFDIIDNISFSSNLAKRQPLNINGQIVQDADRLEAMGTAMIIRALQYGWTHHHILYDPAIKPRSYDNKADYHKNGTSTTINHFYEKGFLLKDLLNTAKAREMAIPRDKIMRDFVREFEREYDETH